MFRKQKEHRNIIKLTQQSFLVELQKIDAVKLSSRPSPASQHLGRWLKSRIHTAESGVLGTIPAEPESDELFVGIHFNAKFVFVYVNTLTLLYSFIESNLMDHFEDYFVNQH